MNPTPFFLAIVFTIITAASAVAGGGACTFQTYALAVLSQSPVLAEFVTSKFSVEDLGKMGPINAPFEGGRRYTFMEFRASTAANKEQKFIIRIDSASDITLKTRANKTDAGNDPYGICRVIDASRSPSPDSKR